MEENIFLESEVLENYKKLEQFKKIFNNININNPNIPPERTLADKNNMKRSEITFLIQALKYNGLVKGKQGSGNSLITNNIKFTAIQALSNTIFSLVHFGYINSTEINDMREKLEIMIFEEWNSIDVNEQRKKILQLKYFVINMEEALNEINNTALNDDSLNKIIKNDVSFHELLGSSTNNTFLSILIGAMAQLRTQEISNFWINANFSQRKKLIETHFLILNTLEIDDIEKRRIKYIDAIRLHYKSAKLN